jgi:hypothetical protein
MEAQLVDKLNREREKLGIPRCATLEDGHSGYVDAGRLQSLVWQAKRERRDSMLWWIAGLSALASVASAVASWYLAHLAAVQHIEH